MEQLFILYLVAEFLIFLAVFIRMSMTNEEEWNYTPYLIGSIIGAVVGLPIGAGTGYLLFNMYGLWVGASFGIINGYVSFALAIFFHNFIHREKKPKQEKEKDSDKKLLLKQLKTLSDKINSIK